MLSVIIPIYNRARTLDACICSVLNAYYQDLEVILVDDGSTDGSVDICRKYQQKDERVHVLVKKNGGVSTARNKGIDYAHGDWITFVDSDDVILPEHFSIIEEAETAGADMTMCMFTQGQWKDGNITLFEEERTPAYSNYVNNDAVLDFLYDKLNPYVHPNFFCHDKCFRRSLVDKYGIRFPEEASLGEDQIFVCEYLKCVEHLLYSTAKTYVRVLWQNSEAGYSLGGVSRSNDNYLQNIRMNYAALKSLYETSGNVAVFRYSMNYLLDRPMRLMIMRKSRTMREQIRNGSSIREAMQKSMPLLFQGKNHLYCVKDWRVRLFDWLLLHGGIFMTMISIRIVMDVNYVWKGLKYRLMHK